MADRFGFLTLRYVSGYPISTWSTDIVDLRQRISIFLWSTDVWSTDVGPFIQSTVFLHR